MKKRLASLFALLSLLAGLAAPAMAIATDRAADEGWRTRWDRFFVRYAEEYAAAHPEEYAAFDDEEYERCLTQMGPSKEELLAYLEIDEGAFRKAVWASNLEDEKIATEGEKSWWVHITQDYEAEFPGDIDAVGIPWVLLAFQKDSVEEFVEFYNVEPETVRLSLAAHYVESRQFAADNHETALKYREQYPESWEEYDPNGDHSGYWEYLKENQMIRFGIQGEEEWKEFSYIQNYEPKQFTRWGAELAQQYPEKYAAFDPYAWFAGAHRIGTPESYRKDRDVDSEEFKRDMFAEWGKRTNSFFNGCCVTVNGAPIQFQAYQDLSGEPAGPKVEGERILIPLRAAAEALALTVEWEPEKQQVVCSNGEKTVRFTLGVSEYSGGTLAAAPFAEKGVTYLPLRALGEALGCTVNWDQEFATASLTTQK